MLQVGYVGPYQVTSLSACVSLHHAHVFPLQQTSVQPLALFVQREVQLGLLVSNSEDVVQVQDVVVAGVQVCDRGLWKLPTRDDVALEDESRNVQSLLLHGLHDLRHSGLCASSGALGLERCGVFLRSTSLFGARLRNLRSSADSPGCAQTGTERPAYFGRHGLCVSGRRGLAKIEEPPLLLLLMLLLLLLPLRRRRSLLGSTERKQNASPREADCARTKGPSGFQAPMQGRMQQLQIRKGMAKAATKRPQSPGAWSPTR